MGIKDWPIDERPRERLLTVGPEALSNAELLAIFLRVGVRGKSAVDLARDLLDAFDQNLTALCTASLTELSRLPGMGIAKAAHLKAILELAGRALSAQMVSRDLLSSPEQVRHWLRLKIGALPHEVFIMLLLDAQNRLIRTEELSRGTLTQTAVYAREVVKTALHFNAASVIFAHNHPSGTCEPSQADELLTDHLQTALRLVEVRVLDHFIVAGNAAPYSFAEHGLI
ncbi:MAG: hypothetical protein RIR70_2157 [Pseudomonadota bacterium]|jgi:DNA repair protein RadC